jgi:signal transduction histidine kinase/CheY-like chemotaxis protein
MVELVANDALLTITWGRRLSHTLAQAKLRTRLMLLVLIAALPPTVLLIYLQIHLRDERRARLAEDVLSEAQLLNADVASVVEGARQLTLAISHLSAVLHADAVPCRARLLELRAELPFYSVIAVVAADGRLVCSTDPTAPANASQAQIAHVRHVLADGGFDVGVVVPHPGGVQSVLPFCLPFTLADGERGVVIADLSLAWFSQHLGALKRPPYSTIGIADRNGLTIARYPNPDAWVGKPFPAAVRPYIGAGQSGTAVVVGYDGEPRLIGFVPPSQTPAGMFVSIGVLMPPLLADIDRATWIGALLSVLGATLSFVLAWSMGERLLRRPTEVLLNAARRWSAGDLSARANTRDAPRSEFGSLAGAFNAMAETLGRYQERLERTVAERTHELRETCDQLQRESAERARSEASLRQAQKLQAVGQLAGGVAHDFNNLLAVVIGSLELALAKPELASGVAGRQLRNALNAAERGARLTRQLLAFARHQTLVPAAIDLNQIVAGMEGLLTSTVGDAIELITELETKLPPALADPTFVESAILNLAINARDAMQAGGCLRISTRSVRAEAGAHRALADYVAIAVADTGTGMPPEVLDRAFEPFFTTKGLGQGSGLGLSQVHGLATKSGGDVQIETAVGVGTTVTLLLPRAAAAPAPAPQTNQDCEHCPRLRILVVDDDDAVLVLLQDALEGQGHDVLLAAGSTDALAILNRRSSAIDLLLTDYAMPGLNGVELIAAARQQRPGLPALLVTGQAELNGDETAGIDILRKPFSMQSLALHVARAVREAVAKRELDVAGLTA